MIMIGVTPVLHHHFKKQQQLLSKYHRMNTIYIVKDIAVCVQTCIKTLARQKTKHHLALDTQLACISEQAAIKIISQLQFCFFFCLTKQVIKCLCTLTSVASWSAFPCFNVKGTFPFST